MSRSKSHDEFLELCAVATSGGLSAAEQERLREHLAVCSSCREAMRQYDAVAARASAAAVPASVPDDLDPGPSWSLERAESSFLARLAQEQGTAEAPGGEASNTPRDPQSLHQLPPLASDAIWRHVWLQYATALLLMIVLGVCVYQIGVRRGTRVAGTGPVAAPVASPPVEQQLSDAGHDREILRAEREQRNQEIADLRRQLAERSAEVAGLKDAQARLEAGLRGEEESKDQWAQERIRLGQQVNAAQARAEALQQTLDSLTQKSSQDVAQDASLQARIAELTRSLKERDEAIDRQQELLAHDRDIRELMGARDLYIAEVYDVGKSGATAKPYGRVFYTKGKSLIFYAYDLDQQKGVKNASTFQAWGRRGTDWKQALNLGIFYEDNSAKKRWILRSNDPKALAQIDAVFVTVEPNGGSQRPSSKPFLFAYLRIDPNHP